MGRKKVPNDQIVVDERRRQITLSKRKKGLFKKAKELAVLTGVDVAVIVIEDGIRRMVGDFVVVIGLKMTVVDENIVEVVKPIIASVERAVDFAVAVVIFDRMVGVVVVENFIVVDTKEVVTVLGIKVGLYNPFCTHILRLFMFGLPRSALLKISQLVIPPAQLLPATI